MPYTGLAASALPIWRSLETYGVDPRPIFEGSGMDPQKLHDPDARYAERAFARLMERCVEVTSNPYFGLELYEHWHPSSAHALGYAWLASETLREAFERTNRYSRVLSEKYELPLEEAGDSFRVTLTHPADHPSPPADYDAFFSLIIGLCRQCAGPDFAAQRLYMKRPAPPDPERFRRHFRSPVHFLANENVFVFSREQVLMRLPTGNPAVAQANDQVVADYMARFDRSDVEAQVRSMILARLSSGEATQESVAAALNTSVRNLQRRLKARGTTYKALLDQIRRDLAKQYVRQHHLSVKEITYLLGFSESANFSRAFKRWTGMSPLGYRESGDPG